MKKISSEQKADIVRRIQVKNPDGTWAETYGALAEEFGGRCRACPCDEGHSHRPCFAVTGTVVLGLWSPAVPSSSLGSLMATPFLLSTDRHGVVINPNPAWRFHSRVVFHRSFL